MQADFADQDPSAALMPRVWDRPPEFSRSGRAALSVWPRTLPEPLRAFCREALVRAPFEARLRTAATAPELHPLLPSPLHDHPLAAALLRDVAGLVALFSERVAARWVGIRLVCPDGPMCPRFHVDFVEARLITTYVGGGPEWVADDHIERRVLGHRSGGRPDEESGLLRPGAEIHQVPLGHVAIFEGDASPSARGRGVVHRSPKGREERRLLLSIDVLDEQGDLRRGTIRGDAPRGAAGCGR